jgi:GH24 family phage-related lysozyme (muramidase)
MERKRIFDAVRIMLGRGFRESEVAALDAAINSALRPDDPDPEGTPVEIGPAGLALIKEFEGCARIGANGVVEAYPDPGTGAAPWTIGWGATGAGIGPKTRWTQAQCDTRLETDLVRFSLDVVEALEGVPTTQNQFDAMVSFHYNTGAIRKATLTRKHKAGDYAGAIAEFGRWNKAGGRVMNGLVRRRAAEAKLYSTPDGNMDEAPLPD